MYKIILCLYLSQIMLAQTYQQEITRNHWQLIGINGFHKPYNRGTTAPAVINNNKVLIKDTADAKNRFTYEIINCTNLNPLNCTYNDNNGDNKGSEKYSYLGFRILEGSGISEAQINYDKKSIRRGSNVVFDESEPFLHMFIDADGEANNPDIEIKFRADFEGENFLLIIDNLSYKGTFNSKYSFDNPAVLVKAYSNNNIQKNIATLFDTDLSDNNLNQLNEFDFNNRGVGGRSPILDENLTVYTWDSVRKNWLLYSNRDTSNDFNKFEAGKAYWVRYQSRRTRKAGFIFATQGITPELYTDATKITKVDNGWNLMSFNDGKIYNFGSGLIIRSRAYANSKGLLIRRGPLPQYFKVPARITSEGENSVMLDLRIAAYINNYIVTQTGQSTRPWRLRAIPLTKPKGIVLLSDEIIDVNDTNQEKTNVNLKDLNITSLTGRKLNFSNINLNDNGDIEKMVSSQVDEYIMGLQLNLDYIKKVFDSDKNATKKGKLEIEFLGEGGNSFDLVFDPDNNISTKTNKISTALSAGNTIHTSKALSLNLNFQAQTINTHDADKYNLMLIASTGKFLVREKSFSRFYHFKPGQLGTGARALNGQIHIVGETAGAINTADNLNDTITKINADKAATGVAAIRVNNDSSYLMLLNDSRSDFRLINTINRFQFTEIGTQAMKNINNSLVINLVGEYYTIGGLSDIEVKNLDPRKAIDATQFNPTFNEIKNGTAPGVLGKIKAVNDNLVSTFYGPSMTVSNALTYDMMNNKTNRSNGFFVQALVSGFNIGNRFYWKALDLTKETNIFKTDYEDLFHINKTSGYWVKLSNNKNNNINIGSISIVKDKAWYGFDNNFSAEGNSTGMVYNHYELELIVNVIKTTDTVNRETQPKVEMLIEGKRIVLKGLGASFRTRISDYDMTAIGEKNASHLKTGIKIIASDGKYSKRISIIDLDNVKPPTPKITFDTQRQAKNQLIVTMSPRTTNFIVFDGNISEEVSTRNDNRIFNLQSIPRKNTDQRIFFAPETLGISYKEPLDLRFIQMYDDNLSLWSNMRRIWFAPTYKGTHILDSNYSKFKDNYIRCPIVFDNSGTNPTFHQNVSGAFANSGVMLRSKKGTNFSRDNNLTVMAYRPNTTATLNTPLTANLEIEHNGRNIIIATIQYDSKYTTPTVQGEGVFYIYRRASNSHQLYYGRFVNGAGVNTIRLTKVKNDQKIFPVKNTGVPIFHQKNDKYICDSNILDPTFSITSAILEENATKAGHIRTDQKVKYEFHTGRLKATIRNSDFTISGTSVNNAAKTINGHTVKLERESNTTAYIRIFGATANHGVGNSITNFNVVFEPSAFDTNGFRTVNKAEDRTRNITIKYQ